MDNREKTIFDLKKLEERDKSASVPDKPAAPLGVPPDGADIENPTQHKQPQSVEDYLKSLSDAAGSPAPGEGGEPHAPPAGHVHFRVAPPRSNASGHFP